MDPLTDPTDRPEARGLYLSSMLARAVWKELGKGRAPPATATRGSRA